MELVKFFTKYNIDPSNVVQQQHQDYIIDDILPSFDSS